MGVFSWIGLATSVAGASGSQGAKDFGKFFTGTYGVTLGTAVSGIYGARNTHIFGTELKLVANGGFGGIGGFFGLLLDEWTLPFVRLMGLGGDVSFAYGARTSVTYGGPQTTIRRGPTINKSTCWPLGFSWINLLTGGLDLVMQQPADPTGKDAADMDKKTQRAIEVLSRLLLCGTAAAELAVAFKYKDYNPKTNEDPFSTPNILNKVFTQLSNTLMAIIYGIETASTYVTANKQLKDNSVQLIAKIEAFLPYVLGKGADFLTWIADTAGPPLKKFFTFCKDQIGWIILFIVWIAVIVVCILIGLGKMGL